MLEQARIVSESVRFRGIKRMGMFPEHQAIDHGPTRLWGRKTGFYEKVKNVKADVAAVLV